MIDERRIQDVVKIVLDPELDKSLLDFGMIRDIRVEEGQVFLTLTLITVKCPKKDVIVEEIKRVLRNLPGVTGVNVKLATLNREELAQLFSRHPLVGLERVCHALAVASGKGGDSDLPLMISSPDFGAGCIFQGIAEKILSVTS